MLIWLFHCFPVKSILFKHAVAKLKYHQGIWLWWIPEARARECEEPSESPVGDFRATSLMGKWWENINVQGQYSWLPFFGGMNHHQQIEIQCIIKRDQWASFSIGISWPDQPFDHRLSVYWLIQFVHVHQWLNAWIANQWPLICIIRGDGFVETQSSAPGPKPRGVLVWTRMTNGSNAQRATFLWVGPTWTFYELIFTVPKKYSYVIWGWSWHFWKLHFTSLWLLGESCHRICYYQFEWAPDPPRQSYSVKTSLTLGYDARAVARKPASASRSRWWICDSQTPPVEIYPPWN